MQNEYAHVPPSSAIVYAKVSTKGVHPLYTISWKQKDGSKYNAH